MKEGIAIGQRGFVVGCQQRHRSLEKTFKRPAQGVGLRDVERGNKKLRLMAEKRSTMPILLCACYKGYTLKAKEGHRGGQFLLSYEEKTRIADNTANDSMLFQMWAQTFERRAQGITRQAEQNYVCTTQGFGRRTRNEGKFPDEIAFFVMHDKLLSPLFGPTCQHANLNSCLRRQEASTYMPKITATTNGYRHSIFNASMSLSLSFWFLIATRIRLVPASAVLVSQLRMRMSKRTRSSRVRPAEV